MRKLENARREAYAQARARGVPICDAYIAAGYKGRKHASRLNRIETVIQRIEELRDDMPWGGTLELAPVVSLLGKAAERAVDLKTAASLVAARGLLVEVAKLKIRLAETAPRAPRAMQLPPALTDDEWVIKHVPRE